MISNVDNVFIVEKKFKKKQIILFSALLISALVAVILILSASNIKSKDIFEKLYYGPTREQVLSEMRIPDHTTYSEGKIWCDYYEDVDFLGCTGKLTVYYRGTDTVTDAHFEVIWENPNVDVKQQADEYGNKVKSFYTKKYGEQKDDDWAGYHWRATSVDIITIYCGLDLSQNWCMSLWLK